MELIALVVLCLIGVTCVVISFLHFSKKGGLLNNVLLYEDKENVTIEERKPLFIQSGIVFLVIGITFILNGIQIISESYICLYISVSLILITFLYILISSSKLRAERKEIKNK